MDSSLASSGPSSASESDGEADWEEVVVPVERPHLEITLQTDVKAHSSKGKGKSPKFVAASVSEPSKARNLGYNVSRKTGPSESHAQRVLRIECHKARLVSLTPLPLQTAFTLIHKSRIPDQAQRGRLFESTIAQLAEWWSGTFFDVEPTGHIRSRTFNAVQRLVDEGWDYDDDNEDGEVIRSPKSLMKHALMRRGSRDISAQLFTALCRALGVPARLVVSLQSVPWQAGVGKHTDGGRKKGVDKGKGKARESESTDNSESDGSEDTKGKAKAVIRLRKTKSTCRKVGSPASRGQTPSPNPRASPPVFWTEVFSRPDSRWISVDPIRCLVNKPRAFDPSSSTPGGTPQRNAENRIVYVIAFEEDSYARDVTPRYAREYGAKVVKAQLGGASSKRGGKARDVWWEAVLGLVTRPHRLHRDDLEDDELSLKQLMEAMPTTLAGFKDHPLYILQRHVHVNEVIHPLVSVGSFRGEPVYPRSSLVSLKTAETWMRTSGRVVKQGEQPMKMAKAKASTVGKMRALEVAGGEQDVDGGKEGTGALQGLYAQNQTEVYVPPPVIDGEIPKNDFGNLDLYVPSMLPQGAVHIPYKGVAKIARQLGFDYAEAVTGFEFRKRRAFPIVEGVVVAAENEGALLEAFWESERVASEKARGKLQERVLKRWTRLVQGLRIRQRLMEQYKGEEMDVEEPTDVHMEREETHQAEEAIPGGFLIGADDVVQSFKLPKRKHIVAASSSSRYFPHSQQFDGDNARISDVEPGTPLTTTDGDFNMDAVVPPLSLLPLEPITDRVPLSMQELAEASALSATNGARDASSGFGEFHLRAQSTLASAASSSSAKDGEGEARSRRRIRTGKKRARKSDWSTRSSSPSDPEYVSSEEGDREGAGRKSVTRNRGRVVAPAASERTLRPRVPKSATKVLEERAKEEAYRKAVAR